MTQSDFVTEKRPVLLRASDIKEESIAWLWDNRFQSNSLNLVSGLAGKGKSFFTVYMAAVVSKGFDWCDHKECERGSVLIFNGEDSLGQVVIPRLKRHGADLGVIRILDGATLKTETGENEDEAVFSLRDTDVIHEAIVATSRETGVQCRLVIIDPVSNHWGDVKENSNAEVRSVLKPLNAIADELGVCIVLVSHTGKSDKEHAQHRTLGSTALPAICRTSWILYEEAGLRTMALAKGNSIIDPTAVTFRIEGGEVQIVSTDVQKTADEHEAECRKTVNSCSHRGPSAEKRNEAMTWLEEALSEYGKPFVAATELKDRWEDAGGSQTTLSRAKASLDVRDRKVTIDGKTFSVWHLPSVVVAKDGTVTAAPEPPIDPVAECPFI
ncbi:MAG: AAA family ATPase [Thermoguttaceae bacterium]